MPTLSTPLNPSELQCFIQTQRQSKNMISLKGKQKVDKKYPGLIDQSCRSAKKICA